MTIHGRPEELVSSRVECNVAQPESLASLGGSAPGLVDGILSHISALSRSLCSFRQPQQTPQLFRPDDVQDRDPQVSIQAT